MVNEEDIRIEYDEDKGHEATYYIGEEKNPSCFVKNNIEYIYVPDDLVENYKTATNWSVYASQIKPLSEYVE